MSPDMAFLAHPCALRHLVHPALKILASFRGEGTPPSEALVIFEDDRSGIQTKFKSG
ncbi:hypothetical protein TUM4249_40250 [Shewanella sp. KT0246]|nr:hypothetical protein TUM4249_40250 [Shewanella sp. KT0246]